MSQASEETVPIPVELYFDYICPFCYIGSSRLDRLGARHPLEIRYRFVEIHPNNPPEGQPLSELGYGPERWRQMNNALKAMVAEDGVPFVERTFTTNSRSALLLASTVFAERPRAFPALHRSIFHAYFAESRNIGDPGVLRQIAETHDVADLIEAAWGTRAPLERLLADVEAAGRIGLAGVPALVVAGRAFSGVVSVDTLEAALQQSSAE